MQRPTAVKRLLNTWKKQKGKRLDCRVNANIIKESTYYMVAKVTMKFENFTKTDIETLTREGDSWKVSSSVNVYK